MNDAPTVSIVVVNLDGRHLLADCLDSLAALDYPPDRVDVVVVDNGSRDDSVRFLTDHYPHVRIVQSRTNLGFAEGNNAGVRAATGELVALVNNDARVDPGWLDALVADGSWNGVRRMRGRKKGRGGA